MDDLKPALIFLAIDIGLIVTILIVSELLL